MNFSIREMKKEDIPHVQDIAYKSWHATYDGIIPVKIQDNFLKSAYSDEMMERRLNHSYIYVAEAQSEIVGFANFTPVDADGLSDLNAIYLYPDYQSRGIGTALLQEGIDNIEGIKELQLEVEKENTAGMQFYKSKGFEVLREYDDDFDGHTLKTVRMLLKI